MNNTSQNWQLYLLPTPEDYLRRKRQTIKTQHDQLQKEIQDLKYVLECKTGLARDLRQRYKVIDYDLAERDGRLQVLTPCTEAVAKVKKANSVKDKETSIGFTTNQIAAIAAALGIEI